MTKSVWAGCSAADHHLILEQELAWDELVGTPEFAGVIVKGCSLCAHSTGNYASATSVLHVWCDSLLTSPLKLSVMGI